MKDRCVLVELEGGMIQLGYGLVMKKETYEALRKYRDNYVKNLYRMFNIPSNIHRKHTGKIHNEKEHRINRNSYYRKFLFIQMRRADILKQSSLPGRIRKMIPQTD